MRFALVFLILFSSVITFTAAQDSPNIKDPVIRLHDQGIAVTVGFSPHYSSFNFDKLVNYGYGIRREYASMKVTPLTNFQFNARANNLSVNYILVTSFPLRPEYIIYEHSGDILNTCTYVEWTQTLDFKLNVYQGTKIGIGYHHRIIKFIDIDSNPTVQFEFHLQNQKNLFLTAEKLFSLNDVLIKPSVSYSIRQWGGAGFNFFSRDNPEEIKIKDYTVPINGLTDYLGLGIVIRNKKIAKNIRLNLRYESYSNTMIENNRYLFGIQYTFNMLDLL